MTRSELSDDDCGADSTEQLIKESGRSISEYRRQRRRPWTGWTMAAIHAMAIAFYAIVAGLITVYINSGRGQHSIYSPATHEIEYKNRLYDPHLLGDEEYFGQPSAEVDSNWEDLMYASQIYLTQDDRRHFDHDLPMVQFPDGSYTGQLFVYHELHCLKRLYQYINADYYFPNLTDHELEMNKMHTAHCLGTLRQAVMCHSDVSVMPMIWGKHSRIPLGDFSSPHQCVNFEKLHAWARQRAVGDEALKPGMLVHPVLGPSFPEGKGTKIGFGDENIDADGHIITLNTPDR